jgi:hypothetical protein
MKFGAAVLLTALIILLSADRLTAGGRQEVGKSSVSVSTPIAVKAAAFAETAPEIASPAKHGQNAKAPSEVRFAGFGALEYGAAPTLRSDSPAVSQKSFSSIF